MRSSWDFQLKFSVWISIVSGFADKTLRLLKNLPEKNVPKIIGPGEKSLRSDKSINSDPEDIKSLVLVPFFRIDNDVVN
jgi:hypothetical protein